MRRLNWWNGVRRSLLRLVGRTEISSPSDDGGCVYFRFGRFGPEQTCWSRQLLTVSLTFSERKGRWKLTDEQKKAAHEMTETGRCSTRQRLAAARLAGPDRTKVEAGGPFSQACSVGNPADWQRIRAARVLCAMLSAWTGSNTFNESSPPPRNGIGRAHWTWELMRCLTAKTSP